MTEEPLCARTARQVVTADTAVSPGWPRRRAGCAADSFRDGTPKPGRPVGRPTPWLAAINNAGLWDPWSFDEDRQYLMREGDLCQVCGGPRGDEVFVLAPLSRTWTSVQMYGGALCSRRCATLTAVVCPHYHEAAPIGVYQVPRHDRVDLFGDDKFNDDEYNVQRLAPIRVLSLPDLRGACSD